MGRQFLTYLEILLVAVLCVELTSTSQWSYMGATGPSHWHELFPEACSGSLQSPINIKTEQTLYNPDLKEFAIYYDPPKPNATMYVKNNGHAVQIDTIGDFYVTNGGLQDVYKTAQFHFHWGHANHHGSEHQIDGQAHPLELHIVNFNSDRYTTIVESATKPLGLAVLGVLFEIVDEDNDVLKPIIEAMEEVRDPDKENVVEIKPVSLRDLLPQDISRYFRYNGSLTTPGCFESVVWTVFQQRQKISLDQILEFRKLLKPKHKKHKNGKHKHHKGHVRRSTAEHNAKEVLDELGIRGNHMEEDELKYDMMEKKAQEATTAPAMDGHGEMTTPSSHMDVELNEEIAKNAQDNIVQHVNEKKAQDQKSREEHHKHMKENEEITEYIQEILVNNFRPVQPINNRLIHRSFKLRQPKVQVIGPKDGANAPQYNVQKNRQGKTAPSTAENGSSQQSRIPVSLLITAILSLLYVRS